MDSQRRTNVEGDRLSSLPDDLIAKILSFNGITQAVETSVLSSRWRFIWTLLPYLNFSSDDFSHKMPKFYKFLTHVFSSYNDQVEFSLNLCGKLSQVFIKKILKDACSRNLQKLTFSVLHENQIEPDLSLFSSQSLKHLSLIGPTKLYLTIPASKWEIPTLTTLRLEYVSLNTVDLFSKCTNLKNLTLINYYIIKANSFTICHPQFSNLTLENGKCYHAQWPHAWRNMVVKVVAPTLKNVTIITCEGKYSISTPQLTSLLYKNQCNGLLFIEDSLPYLEKACVCISSKRNIDSQKIVGLLQQFKNVRFLTLSMEIMEILSSSVNVISNHPSPFVNLVSLKICPESFDEPYEKLTMPTEVINYMLDNSPKATITVVSREEIRVETDVTSVQYLMAELMLLLDQEKSPAEIRPKTKVPRTIPPFDVKGRTVEMKRCWEDLTTEIQQWKEETCRIMSILQRIEELLPNLPASKRAKMQACYSSLCTEADSVMIRIIDRMKIQCDTKGNRIRDSFHDLATTSQPSS